MITIININKSICKLDNGVDKIARLLVNSGKLLPGDAGDNPERSPKGNVQRLGSSLQIIFTLI